MPRNSASLCMCSINPSPHWCRGPFRISTTRDSHGTHDVARSYLNCKFSSVCSYEGASQRVGSHVWKQSRRRHASPQHQTGAVTTRTSDHQSLALTLQRWSRVMTIFYSARQLNVTIEQCVRARSTVRELHSWVFVVAAMFIFSACLRCFPIWKWIICNLYSNKQ